MISGKMKPLVENNSVIRVMFEEGKRLAAIYGAENVYDFSLGNPDVPAPPEVEKAILDTLKEEESTFVHGYMSNAGYEDVRETIARSLNSRFGTKFSQKNILMTVGAASGLEHVARGLTGVGAGGLPVDVLCAQLDSGAIELGSDRGEVDGGRADKDLDAVVDAGEGGDQLVGQGGCSLDVVVHLPVACDEQGAVILRH